MTNMFPAYAIIAIFLWLSSTVLMSITKSDKRLSTTALIMTFSSSILLVMLIVHSWSALQRPPLRTIGETRLWYSVFLPLVGLATYRKWHFSWIVIFCNAMAILFVVLNLFKPENFDQTLMPALQSPWFVPHVVLFMFSYAVLGGAALVALKTVIKEKTGSTALVQNTEITDTLVKVGFSTFTIAMMFGALWAKEAWGHYWTWDPKETWALLSWLSYHMYILYRYKAAHTGKVPLILLLVAFVSILICWFGLHLVPGAKGSMHVYN